MAVIALWSPPRARSTAFFRAMVERGDLTCLHEPLCNLMDHVLADERFLTEVRHTFLVRDPVEIAASHYAIRPEMDPDEIGLEALAELHDAVVAAGGPEPVVVWSDDLADRPSETMAAYCDAVGLPYLADAMQWSPGERVEWRRTREWHAEIADSSRIERRPQRYAHTVDNTPFLAAAAARHRSAFERLVSRRIDPQANSHSS